MSVELLQHIIFSPNSVVSLIKKELSLVFLIMALYSPEAASLSVALRFLYTFLFSALLALLFSCTLFLFLSFDQVFSLVFAGTSSLTAWQWPSFQMLFLLLYCHTSLTGDWTGNGGFCTMHHSYISL